MEFEVEEIAHSGSKSEETVPESHNSLAEFAKSTIQNIFQIFINNPDTQFSAYKANDRWIENMKILSSPKDLPSFIKDTPVTICDLTYTDKVYLEHKKFGKSVSDMVDYLFSNFRPHIPGSEEPESLHLHSQSIMIEIGSLALMGAKRRITIYELCEYISRTIKFNKYEKAEKLIQIGKIQIKEAEAENVTIIDSMDIFSDFIKTCRKYIKNTPEVALSTKRKYSGTTLMHPNKKVRFSPR